MTAHVQTCPWSGTVDTYDHTQDMCHVDTYKHTEHLCHVDKYKHTHRICITIVVFKGYFISNVFINNEMKICIRYCCTGDYYNCGC